MSKVKVSALSTDNEKEVMVAVLDGDGGVVESHLVGEGGTKFSVNDLQTLSVHEVDKGEGGVVAEPENSESEEVTVDETAMPVVMRAKMVVADVVPYENGVGETLNFTAVSKSEPYDENGSDENNTYALYTPTANLSMEVVNPALIGKIKVGEAYYLDFTLAEAAPEATDESGKDSQE